MLLITSRSLRESPVLAVFVIARKGRREIATCVSVATSPHLDANRVVARTVVRVHVHVTAADVDSSGLLSLSGAFVYV